MIVFCKIGWFLSSLSRESLTYSLTLFAYTCSEMILSSIAAFISYLWLISIYMTYILWNIKRVILVSIWFALLCLQPEIFIRPFIILRFCPSAPSSFIFTRWINLEEYLCADYGLISLPMICPPISCSTFYILSLKVCIYLGSTCAPSIYDVATMYAS